MRYSKQREAIYRVVVGRSDHPTAGMVFEALKPQMPSLSLGTVYRNLNQLSDAGRLLKIPLPSGECRFDGTLQDHSHIVCEKCGRVDDVMLPSIERLAEQIEQATHYRLNCCYVTMRGLCNKCRQSGKTSQ